MTIVEVQPIIDWALLLLAEETDRPFGDSQAPDGLSELEYEYPYGVVHHVDSTRWGPVLITADRHLDLILQVDTVGQRRDQARRLQDKVRRILLDVNAAGRYIHDPTGELDDCVIKQRSHLTGPYPAVGEGERPDRVFTITERYTIRVVAEEETP